jgi:glycosyltransferase involved in cell wall biosynthesis
VKGRYIHNNVDVLGQLVRFAPDVVVTTGFNPTFLYAFFYAVLWRRKHVCMTDGTVLSERDLSGMHRAVRRIVFKLSSAFVGASQGSLDLFKQYNCASERLFKSHLCVDNEIFRRAQSASKMYDLLFCGRLTHVKQPFFALDVAERVAAVLRRRVSILYVGTGELEPVLRERAEHCRNVDVKCHGFADQAELPRLYGACRVFLFPTLWDPWGVVVNEACASGLPVVSSPHAGTVGEIIKDGVNAFVRPLEIESWALAVGELLTNEDLYSSFSNASYALVSGHSFEAAAAGIVNAVLTAHRGMQTS